MSEKLSMEELMDLAEEALDRIETGEEWADAHTWMSVMGFVQRVQRMSEKLDKGDADV
ncbi:hypothetical protein [Rhizobium sp. Leaf321]|uniref:hypothetical protein n=1 Tax=Rhizobium sp. Leaf321 TaxID=1736335 RepID=UPI000A549FE6|nr:hypothetical protein [Rhizobium sp. Leaf321]